MVFYSLESYLCPRMECNMDLVLYMFIQLNIWKMNSKAQENLFLPHIVHNISESN